MFRLPRLVARYTRVAASVAIAAGFATVAAPSCAPEAKEVKVAAASANPFAWITDIFGGGVNYSAVAQSIADILDNNDYDDGSYGPLFVRLAWHAAGTYSAKDGSGGSTGCRMRFSPEKNWGANAGLGLARDLLEKVKKAHPGISYADLYALAGVVAIKAMGGPTVPFKAGRTDASDGSTSPPDGRLPDAAQGAAHLRDIFGRMGFSDAEIVALSGAHSLGRCHTDRSGFVGPWTFAPTTFSNDYFVRLLEDTWVVKTVHNGLPWKGPKQFTDKKTGQLMMLPTDLALVEDAAFKAHVVTFSKDKEAFAKAFSSAFSTLLNLGIPKDAKTVDISFK